MNHLIDFLKSQNIAFDVDDSGDITRIKDSLDLEGFAHPFNAPKLTQTGNLYLRGFAHPFNAPKLTQTDSLDLRGFAHPFNAPKLTQTGNLYLRGFAHPFSLSDLTATGVYYDGLLSERTLKTCDGIGVVVLSTKRTGSTVLHRCRYAKFKDGDLIGDACYVVEIEGLTAHGKTVKSAMEDAGFKALNSRDKNEIASEVVKTGIVTVDQFRAITGACREGMRSWLEDRGVTMSDHESLSLTKAKALMSGSSYGRQFLNVLDKAL